MRPDHSLFTPDITPRFEPVEADIDSSFRCARTALEGSSQDHTWHYHPEFELVCVLQGRGTRFVGDSIEAYADGDVVLVGPNLPHFWRNEAGGKAASAEAIVVQFRSEVLGEGLLQLPELRHVRQLLRDCGAGLHLSGELAHKVRHRMLALSGFQGLQRFVCLLETLEDIARAPEQLRSLARIEPADEVDRLRSRRERLEHIQCYVVHNLAGNISQSRIAGMAGLTPAAFSRFFRKATGQTFLAYVNAQRIARISRSLLESSEPVTELALKYGYNNIANFNRQFRALKGMSPTEYRRQRDHLARHMANWHTMSQSTGAAAA